MGVSENRLNPIFPMVLLIIIPMKNGYSIGNINPTFSDKPSSLQEKHGFNKMTAARQLGIVESSNRQHFAELISAVFTDWTLVPFLDSEFQQLTPSLFGWSAKPWKPSIINIAISGLISQLWAVTTPSIPCPCPSRPVMRRSWHVTAGCSGKAVRHRSH